MPEDGWSLKASELTQIFNVAFPKILGHIWSSISTEIDEQKFLTDDGYRRQVIETFSGVALPGEMVIEVDQRSCDVFILTNRGLHLPWPKNFAKIDIDRVYKSYVNAQPRVDLVVPGMAFGLFAAPLVAEGEVLPANGPCLKRDQLVDHYKPPNYDWYVFGSDYQDLVELVPRFVSKLWTELYAQMYTTLWKDKQEFIKELLDEFDIQYHNTNLQGRIEDVVNDGDEVVITNKGLVVPFPHRPTEQELYTSWSQGESGIPTFTYTPS